MDVRYGEQIRDRGDDEEPRRLLLQQPPPSSPPSKAEVAASSPPSNSSSPSHEFSFTISLPPPDHKSRTPPPFAAVDLSPADEIFFHGHLLPLHLLSHIPVSPRSSTNSLDGFTLPVKELAAAQEQSQNRVVASEEDTENSNNQERGDSKRRSKSKSFSLLRLPRWRKGCEVQESERETQKRKMKFDVSQILKRYIRMVFRGRGGNNMGFERKAHSFSGNLSFRRNKEVRGRRGEYSAPASIWTSPTNSGHLVAPPGGFPPASTSDSTMEELQAAIQAAIAHCKNSIATEEKKQFPE